MNHFEILVRRTGLPAYIGTFRTYDQALQWLTDGTGNSTDPLHPFYWERMYEIVLCGGCHLDPTHVGSVGLRSKVDKPTPKG